MEDSFVSVLMICLLQQLHQNQRNAVHITDPPVINLQLTFPKHRQLGVLFPENTQQKIHPIARGAAYGRLGRWWLLSSLKMKPCRSSSRLRRRWNSHRFVLSLRVVKRLHIYFRLSQEPRKLADPQSWGQILSVATWWPVAKQCWKALPSLTNQVNISNFCSPSGAPVVSSTGCDVVSCTLVQFTEDVTVLVVFNPK